ncbi:Uma2 family endonuclease [Actinomadura sp. 21ATH]|uniref:Uma2 family endonuclease n=1 Tax=Actinomadura sp. 21ATH TaxID=1735444 RepID=UPI0035C18E16
MSIAPTHDHGGFGPYTIEDLHAREDDGKGLELEDGWLIEWSPSAAHNWAAERLRRRLEHAAEEAGAAVFIAGGGEWEISTPAGIRKPDVFLVPSEVARASIVDRSPITIPGGEVLLAVEVISPGSGSERSDRVRKLREYAGLGIPQYWLAEFTPRPRVQVMVLDDDAAAYRADALVAEGETLDVTVQADKPLRVRFDPRLMIEF